MLRKISQSPMPQWNLFTLLIIGGTLIALIALIGSAQAQKVKDNNMKDAFENSFGKYRDDRPGLGSLHEMEGKAHFAPVKFSKFRNPANYTLEPTRSYVGMEPVYKIIRTAFNMIFTDDPPIPDGYLILKENRIQLGPKTKANDWRDLLIQYWFLVILVLLLVVLIALVPFIGFCYCCFCCAQRCRKPCPPCEVKNDWRGRLCYGFLLLLLIIGILFGVIIAFANNKLLERGFEDTTNDLKRASRGACTFLQATSQHINHLYVKNYEEMQMHLEDQLIGAGDHIVQDLADVSKANSINELNRIMNNIDPALPIMIKVNELEKELRFLTSQLRDALRGFKRQINDIATKQCDRVERCLQFIKEYEIDYIDDLSCMHYDNMPNVTIYVDELRTIISNNYSVAPKYMLQRLRELSGSIKDVVRVAIPPIVEDIQGGGSVLREQVNTIKNLVDSVVNNFSLNAARGTDAFEDFYAKFGAYRNLINVVVCLTLALILFCLSIALVCGCCGRRALGYRDDCCNKSTGSTCLSFAIFFIFISFSVITMIALFYLMFGVITYHGACAPMRDHKTNPLFKQFDNVIDLNQLISPDLFPRNRDKKLDTLRISKAIETCKANRTIYEVLQINNLYNIKDLRMLKVLRNLHKGIDQMTSMEFPEDLSKVVLMTDEERAQMDAMRTGPLGNYHSSRFLGEICNHLTKTPLKKIEKGLEELAQQLPNKSDKTAVLAFKIEALHIRTYQEKLVAPILEKLSIVNQSLLKIDDLILYHNHNFSDSIGLIINDIKDSEEFIRNRGEAFVNDLGKNLTKYLKATVDGYVTMVTHDSEYEVGHCAPLANIYDQTVDLICKRLVDPLNGFWFGVLICTLLFLPVLWVAHKLQSLYKRVKVYNDPMEPGDYLYDAYSERDHMPLSSTAPKKRRKGYDRRQREHEYYEEAAVSPGLSQASIGAHRRDARYSDMAPKHWDTEPPRYHHSPMAPPASEYERPPPYYYPGAVEQD